MTHEILEWNRRAKLLEFDQLASLRKAAEQWRNGLGALTGTLATVGILKGTATFRELTPDGRRMAVVLLGAAFVLLLAGTSCAMRAAFAHPGVVRNTGEDLEKWTVAETKRSAKYLRFSKGFTLLALISLAFGTVVTWVDSGESPKSLLAVVLVDGSKICGTIQESKDGGFDLLVDAPSSQKMHLRFADVRSFTVGKC